MNLTSEERLMSDQIDLLATSLAKAQGEFCIAYKTKDNPFFKSSYADFESIVSASRPALTSNGISIIQSIISENGSTYLITLMMHSSGQWIKSKAQHNPVKTDIQSLSSYNTYLRRMCYSSLVGVVTGEDDDGEAASSYSRTNYVPVNTKITPSIELVSNDQIDYLEEALNGYTDIAKDIFKGFNVSSLDQLPKAKYSAIVNRIIEVKRSLEKK